ncbi:hypothetical protein BDB01DRAFT_787630 [Pilobolus umbonatus]|nr:hypothetical protein BDB01DRAFT_787630 [Pilobolus umbonatus]
MTSDSYNEDHIPLGSNKSSLASSFINKKPSTPSTFKKLFGRFPHNKSPPLLPSRDFHHSKPSNHSSIHSDISKCPAMSASSISIDDEMSPSQSHIDLVRVSWERVSEIRHIGDDRNVSSSHAFGLAFYEALFEMDQEIPALFDNVFQQARALSGMISYIARSPTVTGSGIRPACCSGGSSTNNDTPPQTPTTKRYTIREINARKRRQSEGTLTEDEFDEGDPEWLTSQMRELGARHYFYKVEPHHLALVGPAFVCALQKRLGKEYTPEIGDSWLKATSYAVYNMSIGYESQQAWEEGRDISNAKKAKAACMIQ